MFLSLRISVSKEKLHSDLHRWFLMGVNAAEEVCKIYDFYGAGTVSDRNARKWFKMFREGRKTSKRKRRSGRPQKVDKSKLKRKFARDPTCSTRELASGI